MIYCISDIHGEYQLFLALLKEIRFNKQDTLIVLGDMIDKGSESIRLLKYLFSQDNIKCILGNHEYDFLKYYNFIMSQVEDNADYDVVLQKIQKYFSLDVDLLTWDILDKIETLPLYLEYPDFICVHSGVPLDEAGQMKPLNKAKAEELLYNRDFKDNTTPVSDKCIIFGHTPTQYLQPGNSFIFSKRLNHSGKSIRDFYQIHLDTGVYLSGVLGCLCIDDCRAYYVKK